MSRAGQPARLGYIDHTSWPGQPPAAPTLPLRCPTRNKNPGHQPSRRLLRSQAVGRCRLVLASLTASTLLPVLAATSASGAVPSSATSWGFQPKALWYPARSHATALL